VNPGPQARSRRDLGGIEKDVRDERKPVAQAPVDVVGDVLGPVGADLVAERHPRGHDEVLGPNVHGAQVEQRVNARGVLDLGPYHREP